MPYFLKPSLVLLGLTVSILLGGCGAKPECDSFETRNAVLQTIADDHNNALATFAAKNPNPAKPGNASSESENQKPLYVLGEKMVTTSTSEDKRTLTCSGAISVTVGGTKASKEVNSPSSKRRMAKYRSRSRHFSFEPFGQRIGLAAIPTEFALAGGCNLRNLCSRTALSPHDG
jgi:hypothetical protein